jgi:hypothetical protein
MFKTTIAAAAVAAATLTAGAASAQYAPMDMSAMVAAQVRNQQMGDYMAYMAGMRAYQMLAQARAAGRPFNGTLVLGNNPNTFGDGGYAARARIQSRSAYDYDQRAVRGNCLYQNAYGQPFYAPC